MERRMKKWVVGLGAALVLMGCNGTTNEETEKPIDDTPDTEENQDPETDVGSETDTDTETDVDTETDTETDIETDLDEDTDTDLGDSDDDTETDADLNESETMTFVPQLADTEAGLTIENDEVLSILNELVETSDIDDVGIPDDVTIQFTGLYLDDAEQELLLPIFLISNRTEEAYTNVEMAITFGATDGELLFEETSFMLGESDFGVLEPNTAMPVYLNADYSYLELVESISQSREESISIDSFDAETVDNQNGAATNTINTNGQSQPQLTFIPTASQEQEGVTTDNDLILNQLQELIDNAAEVGIEGDIVIHWTGIYEFSDTEENGDAVFIIVNRSGEDLKNIELGIQFTDANNNVILQDERFYLAEDEFGILENQTIKPLYLEIPEDKEQFMIGLEDVNQAFYAFEHFDAEPAN